MTKIKIFVTLITAVFFLNFFSGCVDNTSSAHKTIYVDTNGGKDYSNIESALKAAGSGDTIYVASGSYYELLSINKAINLVGFSAATTFIFPKEVGLNNNSTISINIDGCIIKGFNFSYSGQDYENTGVRVYSSNNTIVNNAFSNFDYGINLISDSSEYIIYSNNISGNEFSDCKYGLYSRAHMKNNTFLNNSFTRNQEGIDFYYAVNNSIVGNVFVSNWMYGIFIQSDSDGNDISYNYLENNNYGIRFKGVSYNEIYANKLVKNNIGLYSCCGSIYNKLYNNSLINNSKQAADAYTNHWDNGEYGNYWSDYLVKYPNATENGTFWNIPYNISDGSNIDNFPLVKPVV